MRRAASGIIAAFALCASLAQAQGVPEPEGFRGPPYRAAVPATLSGATVVDDDAAYKLWQEGEVAFIDVLPRAPKPENLPMGTIWREKPRQSIPGAIWLPNTGYEQIAKETAGYLRQGLEQATEGDPAHPVLFFCLMDCWMSWNVAKRALEMGYEAVYWYPDGTDGWDMADHPLERLDPLPDD